MGEGLLEAGRSGPQGVGDVVLRIDGLRTEFRTRRGVVPAVRDLSLTLRHAETLGLVGESGCGKSVTALSILRLIPPRLGHIANGRVVYQGRNLVDLAEHEMRGMRGGAIAMIFQEPMTALNPVLTIGQQIVETILMHEAVSAREARARAIEMLRLVQISEAERQIDSYPHMFSGGMRQRAMIAMALACNPKVLIADEPTTALDVTIQAQILELMQKLQSMLGTSIIMITHDLGVIAEMAHRVAVMYAGTKVEEADVQALFDEPLHPYTRGLLNAIPDLDSPLGTGGRRARLNAIDGTVPALGDLPRGCSFAPRCPAATSRCSEAEPLLEQKRSGHWVACWNAPAAAAAAGRPA